MDQLKGQLCPICSKKTCTLTEHEEEAPYFGKLAIFAMQCDDCGFKKSDVESVEKKDPCKWTFEITSEEDLKARVVKSSEATVKIPRIITMDPGPASNGYVTNVEGILNRAKDAVETMKESEDDPATQKKCKNMLKKIQRILWGRDSIKITIEDPSGNSAIVAEKASCSKL
jgi:zinc finger protein